MSVDPKAFRNALGSFATGVTVITTLDKDGNKVGMTANSFNSVSLDPMLVLWSIAKTSNAFAIYNEAEHFAIHILGAEQQAISNQFASKGADRFAGIDTKAGIAGIPVLTDCKASFQCKLENRFEGGDHIILVGRVEEFETQEDKAPLIFHAGGYAELAQEA